MTLQITDEVRNSALMPEFPPRLPVAANPTELWSNYIDPQRREQVEVKMYDNINDEIRKFADDTYFRSLETNTMGNAGLNVISRLSVAPGGGTYFQPPRNSNGPPIQKIIATIPHLQQTRRRFTNTYGTNGGDNIPDCMSVNVTPHRTNDRGFGNPGGECMTCPHDQFIDQIGRACTERQALFILAEDQFFPQYLDLSVYSQQPLQEYLQNMMAQRLDYWQVVHEISLGQHTTRSGRSIAVFNARPVGIIDATDPEICKGMENIRKLAQIVLRDFTVRVESNKTIRLNNASVEEVQYVNQSAMDNMPVPASLQPSAPVARTTAPSSNPVPPMPAPQAMPAPQPMAVTTPPPDSQSVTLTQEQYAALMAQLQQAAPAPAPVVNEDVVVGLASDTPWAVEDSPEQILGLVDPDPMGMNGEF